MKKKVNWIWSWVRSQSVLTQTVVFFLASGILNAFILIFAVKYSTYTFALNNGFRPPFEGIPYLDEAIIFFAATLWVSKFIILQLLRSLTYMIATKISAFIKRWHAMILNYPKKKFKGTAKEEGTLAASFAFLTSNFIRIRIFNAEIQKPASGLLGKNPEDLFKKLGFTSIVSIAVVMFVALETIFQFIPSSLSEFGKIGVPLLITLSFLIYIITVKVGDKMNLYLMFVTAFFVLCVPFSLFVGDIFPRMLSYLGYGGGRMITLEHVSGGIETKCLMLRTRESIFFSSLSSSNVVELKISDTLSITYIYPSKRCEVKSPSAFAYTQ